MYIYSVADSQRPYYSESAVVSLYKYPNFRKRVSTFIGSVGTLYPLFFAAAGAPVFVLSPPGYPTMSKRQVLKYVRIIQNTGSLNFVKKTVK